MTIKAANSKALWRRSFLSLLLVWALVLAGLPLAAGEDGDGRAGEVGPAVFAPRAVELRLEDVLNRIASQNLTVLLNREVVEEVLQRSNAVRAALFPEIDLALAQTRSQAANVGRGVGLAQRSGPQNRFNAVIAGSMPLLNLDKIADYRLAKLGYEISELRYQALMEAILTEAAGAFYLHLRNLNRLDVIDANIERDEVLLEISKQRFDVGVATQLDVTRSEVQLAGDQLLRLQQETAVFRSAQLLKRLLDLDLDRDLILVDPDFDRPTEPAPHIESMESILLARPDFREALAEQKQNRLARRAADWQRLPSVELFSEYGYASETVTSGNYENQWLIGAAVSVPIFEGFRIRSNRLQADARIRSQDYFLRELENRIGSEYRIVKAELDSRYKQIAIAEQRIRLSRQELDLATNRFEEGVADNREVVDAQSNLAQSEDELVEAIFDYNLSRLELARTLGNVRLLLVER